MLRISQYGQIFFGNINDFYRHTEHTSGFCRDIFASCIMQAQKSIEKLTACTSTPCSCINFIARMLSNPPDSIAMHFLFTILSPYVDGSCHEASFFLYRSAWGLQLTRKLCGYLYARQYIDVNLLSSIALTVAILISGHPHPMPRSIIEKSLRYATRRLLQPFTSYSLPFTDRVSEW